MTSKVEILEFQHDSLIKLYNSFEDECTLKAENFRAQLITPMAFDSYCKLVPLGFQLDCEYRLLDISTVGNDNFLKLIYVLYSYEIHLESKLKHFVSKYANMVHIVQDQMLSKVILELNKLKSYLKQFTMDLLNQVSSYLATVGAVKLRLNFIFNNLIFPTVRLLLMIYLAVQDNKQFLLELELFQLISFDFVSLIQEIFGTFSFPSKLVESFLVSCIISGTSKLWWISLILLPHFSDISKISFGQMNKILKAIESRPPVLVVGVSSFDLRQFFSLNVNQSFVPNFNVRLKYLRDFDNDLKVVYNYELSVLQWIVRMNTEVSTDTAQRDMINTRIALLIQGMELCEILCSSLIFGLSEHLNLSIPIPGKNLVWKIVKLIQLAKMIIYLFREQNTFVKRNVDLYLKHIEQSIQTNYNQMNSQRSVHPILCLVASELDPAIQASSSLDVTLKNLSVLDSKYKQLVFLYQNLERFDKEINVMIVNNRNIIESFVKEFTAKDFDIKYLVRLISDLFEDECLTIDKQELQEYVENNWLGFIVKKATDLIEKEARIMVYRQHDEQYNRNSSFAVPYVMKLDDCNYQIHSGRYFNLKYEVEIWLHNVFYNFLTKNTNDWIIYKKMLLICQKSYGLRVHVNIIDSIPNNSSIHLLMENEVDNGKPNLNSDVSIDNLIEIFVNKIANPNLLAEFSYSFVNNCFLQNFSNSNYLLVLKLNQMTNVLNVGGIYEIQSLYGSLYDILKSLMSQLYELVYEDSLQALLLKEWRSLQTEKRDIFQPEKPLLKYNFAKIIRVITCVGNVVGIVRLANSACSLYYYSLGRFYNFDDDDDERKDLAKDVYMKAKEKSKEFKSSSENFLVSMTKTIKESTDQGPALNFFYLLVPFISQKHVNEMISKRLDLLKARQKSNTVTSSYNFVNDGFYMGISYVLYVFHQISDFESLHFFDYIQDLYAKEANSHSIPTKDPKIFNIFSPTKQTTIPLEELNATSHLKEYEIMKQVMHSTKLLITDYRNFN